MQDQLYTSAIKQARNDLRQAYGDSPLDDIPPEHEWKKSIYAYSDAYSLIVVAHFYGSSVDIGEWNKHSTETASQYSNDEDGSFAWVAMNADDLYQKYPDRWILVDKARVVGTATQPQELMKLAHQLGIKEPFITITTPPAAPGKALYGGKIL